MADLASGAAGVQIRYPPLTVPAPPWKLCKALPTPPLDPGKVGKGLAGGIMPADVAEMDEACLVRAASAGSHEAYARLVLLFQARLRGFVARFLADGDDVLDLVQESFIEAWKSLPRFEDGRPYWPWLRAIAKNRVRMHLRTRARHPADHLAALDEMVADAAESLPDDDEERITALRRCLGELGREQRALIQARYYDNAAVQDIAAGEQATPASVTMRLQRLRLALKGCLERRLAGGGA